MNLLMIALIFCGLNELDIIFSSLKDLIPDNITYYEKDSN